MGSMRKTVEWSSRTASLKVKLPVAEEAAAEEVPEEAEVAILPPFTTRN